MLVLRQKLYGRGLQAALGGGALYLKNRNK